MSKDSRIVDSAYCRVGEMTCKDCKKPIPPKSLYLVVENYDIRNRGNEHDFNEIFCYPCTKDRKVWKIYFEQVEKEKLLKQKEMENTKSECFRIIRASKNIEIEEDGNFYQITVQKK